MTDAPAADAADAANTSAGDVRVPLTVLSVLALLQAIVVLMTGPGIVTGLLAVALAIAGAFVRLPALTILAGVILVNFCAHLVALAPPYPYRLAEVAILVFYGGAIGALLLTLIARMRFELSFAVTMLLAIAFVAAEAVIPRAVPASILRLNPPRLVGEPRPYARLETVYPDNPRGYFDTVAPQYSLKYDLNAFGCRGADYPIPRPSGRRRILVLGGASAFGEGVRDRDTFAARLEQSLRTNSQPSEEVVDEVINCGMRGSSTREQRVFYEQIASSYQPHVVLLAMTDRDNLSASDERRLGLTHQPARYEHLLLSARLVQYSRHEGRRAFDASPSLPELITLQEACSRKQTSLVVVLFGSSELSPHWKNFATTVTSALAPAQVPVLDLDLPLLKDHMPVDLVVDPIDTNLNEIAHRVAADEIERFLRAHRVIG